MLYKTPLDARRPRRSLAAGVLSLSLLLGFGIPTGQAGEPGPVAVLVSQDGAPYQQALAGIQQAFRQRRGDLTLTVYPLMGDAGKASAAAQAARRSRPSAIVTLGTLASHAIAQGGPGIPVAAALIPTAEAFHRLPATSVLLLDHAPDVHFHWLQKFLPEVRVVGVLFNRAENGERIAAAMQAASRAGLTLDAVEVRDGRDVPVALETVTRRANVLWGISDSVALTPETARQVLLTTFRARIPLIGPSRNWVKAGALYALHWDFYDVGLQAGEAVLRLLQNPSTGESTTAFPRKVLYAINQRTSEQLKIELADVLLRGASDRD
jgi:putative ABC transport system substrate-binding protein